jgi:hypothetical protein
VKASVTLCRTVQYSVCILQSSDILTPMCVCVCILLYRDESDEKIRIKDEDIFIAAYVKKIRKLITRYLATRDGIIEVNHVINEIEKINIKNDTKNGGAITVPPEVKKKDNVFQIFRTFDTDGSGTIDM